MLIFDRFPSREQATAFARSVRESGLQASVYDSQEISNRVDPFPFKLDPPIVLIERPPLAVDATEQDFDARSDREEKLRSLVSRFGGHFAGT